MKHRFVSLLVLGFVFLIIFFDWFDVFEYQIPALAIGLILLTSYCIGYFFDRLLLPRITGYIICGLVFGPYVLNIFKRTTINELNFLNSLALAYIAFCAGGELKISSLKNKFKVIIYLISGVTIIVFVGITLSTFLFSDLFPFMQRFPPLVRLSICSLFGIIAIARSPSSTIAIISETKAHGSYTDTVLSTTILTDVLIIILFGIVISICQAMVYSGTSIDVMFIVFLLFEVLIALAIGFVLGKLIIYLIEKVHLEFPVIILGVGFMVIKLSHYIADYLKQFHQINLNIEPLLICMAAGFTVQNFSSHGHSFLTKLDRVSLPIYILFFTITGASIKLDVLTNTWFLGLMLVVLRILMIFIGSLLSGVLSGDSPLHYKNTWLAFITQAGVSLGLLTEIVRRFPDIGPLIQTVLISVISVNQIVGPIAFKFGLKRVGEENQKKR